MDKYSWECPFCQKNSTISENYDISYLHGWSDLESLDSEKYVKVIFIVCPNPKCNKLTMKVELYPLRTKSAVQKLAGNIEKSWNLLPDSNARVYPDYVPVAIRKDYEEACKIKDLSPKASATLARRCLQGMIRDFWSVKKPSGYKGIWNLKKELEAIQENVEPDVWTAMDSVRKVGNIGAHMEMDVNLIIDVDIKETQTLIELIEMLMDEWYINRFKRKERLEEVKRVAEEKEAKKLIEGK